MKGVSTPGVNPSEKDAQEDDDEPLSPDEASLYRACAARCNFLGLDRPDLQYSAKEVSRGMARPTINDMHRLKRISRYLIKYPRANFYV